MVDNWPRIVQLAWVMCDEIGHILNRANYIIKPDGFTISKQSSKIHGITTERAMKEGVNINDALIEFSKDLWKSQFLVAHNMGFDKNVIFAESIRSNQDVHVWKQGFICTMKDKATINFCKLSGPRGYKWPNLMELHKKLFKEGFDDAHDAMADVNACTDCFFELKRLGIIKE